MLSLPVRAEPQDERIAVEKRRVSVNEVQRSVLWAPGHPAYGSVSMSRYTRLLEAQIDINDRYAVVSALPALDESPPMRGRARRMLSRYVTYPLRIRGAARTDIVHILDHSFAELLRFRRRGSLSVVTVHDLIPLRFQEDLDKLAAERFRKRVRDLYQVDRLVTISEYTKGEIVELLGVEPDRIHIVMPGVEPSFAPTSDAIETRVAQSEGEARTLRVGSIGSIHKRKNLGVLPAALSRAIELLGRPISLVRVGARLPKGLRDEIVHALGSENRLIELGVRPDDEVAAFYAAIDLLVVPSLYEGFGLPVLEGLAAGRPVVASNTTSLPEAGGDAVVYFDPNAPEELASRIVEMAEPDRAGRFVEAGKRRAAHFTWRRSLEGLYSVYDEMLSSNGGV